jgi:heparin binding hemagglutinin HbhA
MPVSIPTAADVRKAREQAAERAEAARTPLLAVLGAGDYAYTTVTKAVVEARTRATAQAEEVQHRVAELPQRLSPEALRALVAELRAEAEERYGYFARRGESTWGKLRKQPQVKQAITTIETYTEKLDARVDVLVDDAHDAAEKALATVTRQTRSAGEKAARATQRAAAETAGTVAEAGEDAAAAIAEACDEVAAETRSASRKAANRTAPKTAPKAAPKAATRKPAARRTANGTASGS